MTKELTKRANSSKLPATPYDLSPSSAEEERAGWWPWSHSCHALNHGRQTLDIPDGVCWAARKADNLRPLPRARCDGDGSECQPEMPAPGWLSPSTYVPVSPLGIRCLAWWLYAEKGRNWLACDCHSQGTWKSSSQSGYSSMKPGLSAPQKHQWLP